LYQSNLIIMIFRFLILSRLMPVDLPKTVFWKSAIYHSIKLSFNTEVAEKFLYGIWYPLTISSCQRSLWMLPYFKVFSHCNYSWYLPVGIGSYYGILSEVLRFGASKMTHCVPKENASWKVLHTTTEALALQLAE
jgi:hypothetical protein